jgi:glycosyltransferase involved in cell wall biosynthesis
MIHLDVTKTRSARHRSGLTRVTTRLAEELGTAATPITWPMRGHQLRESDWLLTAELFSEEERPGWTSFLDTRRCRAAAIFHDAIPLRHPQITWPQSVARQPGYMKLLARFDHIWAVSDASRNDLLGFWRWQGILNAPPVHVLPLGADFDSTPRRQQHGVSGAHPPQLLCIGIIEPRKNQGFLIEMCEQLWREGLDFDLHLVGRVNPHFGQPLAARLKTLARNRTGIHFHAAASDPAVTNLYRAARATAFPTIAEGCGLPALESPWMGVPCLASDLPALRETASDGGIVLIPPNDPEPWLHNLRRVITDDAWHASLRESAQSRPLPTWREAACAVEQALH